MLLHQANLSTAKGVCPLHGAECPNEAGREHQFRPLHGNKPILYGTSTADLLKIAKSQCIIASLFARIAISRRLTHVQARHFYQIQDEIDPKTSKHEQEMVRLCAGFDDFVRRNLWYILDKASVRMHVSTVETYAELEETAGPALAAIMMVRMERMARMVTTPKKELIVASYGVAKGIQPSCATPPDGVMNLFYRLRHQLLRHPTLWMVFYRLLQHELTSLDHLFRTCDNLRYYELYDFPPSSAVEYAKQFLRPSPVDVKHWKLYFQQHKETHYGGGAGFPDRDKNFLHAHGCKILLDYGCGRGVRDDPSFTWLKYDPCVPAYWEPPKCQVDGLVSYDVLEHVPEDELDITARWVELYAPKCLVLGISTRTAATILPNGENAHCTVRNSEWWAEWAKRALPFRLVRKFNDADYVILHMVRV